MIRCCLTTIFCLSLTIVSAAGALAQDRQLFLELNNMQTDGDVCRVSFVATNNMGVSLEAVSFEVVVFDQDQLVDRILLLEFGELPIGKTRVVQFDLDSASCDQFSRLLINDAARCEGSQLEPRDCVEALQASSRQPVTFGL